MAHRDAMVALRSELAGAGYSISDQSFYEQFMDSLPRSMDMFVALYDDVSADVDAFCNKFTRYEMRIKLADIRDGKEGEASGSSMALASQQPSSSRSKGKGRKRDLSGRLEKVTTIASARGAEGEKATLLTWHRRLGHSSFKTVVASAKGGVIGMQITDLPMKIPGLDACAACVAARSVHLPHKEGRSRASEYLERVHIDITGPMPVKSAGGREYLYLVVDDYTRAVYVKPLKLKSEAVEAFKAFKAVAENESGKKMREVMTDNARELSMGEMRNICEREGIKLHTTIPRHPASNGVAGRTIGVLTGAVRAMLRDSGLSDMLWAEAFVTAAYVHNRTPTRVLKGLTPFEVRYGAKPDLAHLRAFGAPCSIVEPLEKPDDRATMCFFVGYKCGGGGYRVWDPKGRDVVESKDVVFYEDGLPPPTLSDAMHALNVQYTCALSGLHHP